MYHSVYTAEIYEGTVACEALHYALVVLALFNICPEGFLCGFALFSLDSLDGADRTAAILFDFDYLEFLCCADECGKITVACYACLRCGNEYLLRKCGNNNAALHCLDNLSAENLTVLKCFRYEIPVVLCIYFLLGKSSDAFHIVYSYCDSFYSVTDFEKVSKLCLRIVCNICKRQNARNLTAEIQLYFGSGYRSYYTRNGVSCI